MSNTYTEMYNNIKKISKAVQKKSQETNKPIIFIYAKQYKENKNDLDEYIRNIQEQNVKILIKAMELDNSNS